MERLREANDTTAEVDVSCILDVLSCLPDQVDGTIRCLGRDLSLGMNLVELFKVCLVILHLLDGQRQKGVESGEGALTSGSVLVTSKLCKLWPSET
jgi:hypothetical protein